MFLDTPVYSIYNLVRNMSYIVQRNREQMQEYIDIHSHILYGVDDGAQSFEESMEMLRLAFRDGIRQIILTPHNKPMRNNVIPEQMAEMRERLQNQAKKEGMEITLYLGNEIYYRSSLLEDVEEGKAVTMTGSAYTLIEYNPMEAYAGIRKGMYETLSGGLIPILAHVERYDCLMHETGYVKELVDMGCFIQVNAGSIMGEFGLSTRLMVRKLLKQRLVHFVATDAHNTGKRKPCLSASAEYVAAKYGTEYQRQLFYENPRHIIEDRYI